MEQQVIAVHYQRMEEWLGDRKAVLGKKHKKEFTRLMELAPKLEQLVRYDIPSQHKQQKKLSSALDDAYSVIEDATKARQNLEERERRFLQEYGFAEGQSTVEEDLESAVNDMVASSTILLNNALREFGKSTHIDTFREVYVRVAQMHSMGMDGNDIFSAHFPWLDRVYQERNCKSMAELQQHDGQESQEKKDEEAVPCEIDWGDMDAADPIDIGAAVEIKWDSEVVDFGVEAAATDVSNNVNKNSGAMEDCYEEKLPDKVEGVFSIDFSNSTHRQNILTELQALLCFALERSSMDDASLADDGAAVDALMKRLTTSTEAGFVRMKTSPTLRISFMEEVRRFQRGIAAADLRKHNSQSRLHQLHEELERLGPQLETLVNDARACRDECLAELMKMFPGRTVNIVGDINKYL